MTIDPIFTYAKSGFVLSFFYFTASYFLLIGLGICFLAGLSYLLGHLIA